MTIIGLITDFGTKGAHYIASMKGVILRINPNVQIIDISHDISSYSIIEASYIIKSTYKFFPEKTLFLIVVDPGVGSNRNILAIKTKSGYIFIGPNNGIFSNALNSEIIDECIKIENDIYFNKPVSKTFHGRDIIAPVGAYITNGISLVNFGPQFDQEKITKFPMEYEEISKKKIRCTIQFIDNFGNLITNIEENSLSLEEGNIIELKSNKNLYKGRFVNFFESVPVNSLIFLIGSSGYLEISINQGNAAEKLSLKVGDIIEITS
ncbi:MAG: SAM hydrolase/SAM-dependent halogenase family protein [Promethearchaeota archaeon]